LLPTARTRMDALSAIIRVSAPNGLQRQITSSTTPKARSVGRERDQW
jgi:hypothetical protein